MAALADTSHMDPAAVGLRLQDQLGSSFIFFSIEIVLIDRRYQGKGFGKFMLRFAVDYLKKAGAKKLSIGVNRFNIPAQKLYKSVGFNEDCVYEEGIFMTQILSED